MDTISSGCYVIDQEYNVVNINQTARSLYPQLQIGEKCYKCLLGIDHPCGPCPVAAGRKGPNTYVDPIRQIRETVDAVDIDIEGHGPCHMLIFSTVGIREDYAATLPLEADELTNLALVKALTTDYLDVFSLNIATGQIRLFRLNGKPIPMESVYRNDACYEDEIHKYCRRYVVEEEQERFLDQNTIDYLQRQLLSQEYYNYHYRVNLNGEEHYFVRRIARVGDGDSFNTVVIGIRCEDELVRGRERNLELEKSIARIEYDNQTGLYTREAFIQRSEQLLAAYPDAVYDFCICRFENLGMINHQYGRNTGDRVLSLIGHMLADCETEDNCIGYLGDGVYAAFTPNASRVRREATIMDFQNDFLQKSDVKSISLKWSVYTHIEREQSIDEIIEKTNYALSTIRQSTHRNFIEFDQSVIEQMEKENAVENGFDQALENGEFIAWYQPKYEIRTGVLCGAEALVRWRKPDGTMVPPMEFIPVLERCGKIDVLDEHVFRTVCQLKKQMAEQGLPDLPVSVNLSRASLFKRDIAGIYRAIADEHGADCSRLPIEITESAAVRAMAIHDFARRLIQEGFSLHMDDFGSGYSSLASLQIIPYTCIKLDKSLIDNIGHEDSETLLRHTVAFARECGKQVVAEGVESYEQALFLKVIGCDIAQGYYYSRPVPQEVFLEKLKELAHS